MTEHVANLSQHPQPAAPQPVPAANREQPSRSSLNVPQAVGSAQAAERK